MLKLNYRDSRPIYEQIKDGICDMMLSDALGAGEKLPSVRELATMLAINPNTIQRAYRELEQAGYIYSIPGKGSFAGEVVLARKKRVAELEITFDKTVLELRQLGVTNDELVSRMKGGVEQ